jgi:hypothetical protein
MKRRAFLAVGAVSVLWPKRGVSQSRIDEILDRATSYVETFFDRLSNVVAEERYHQETTSPHRRRQLTSDFLLVKLEGANEWVQFRDVFEVNGKAVRERDERLTKLFFKPSQSALAQARAIVEEGSRHNLVYVGTVNNPLIAIAYLQSRYRKRFRFWIGRRERGVSPDVWLINFEERAIPTILGNGRLFSHGHLWVEETSGRVVKTELRLGGNMQPVQVVTSFQYDDRLQTYVPGEMREWYPIMTGLATYSRFRRFEVQTEEKVR